MNRSLSPHRVTLLVMVKMNCFNLFNCCSRSLLIIYLKKIVSRYCYFQQSPIIWIGSVDHIFIYDLFFDIYSSWILIDIDMIWIVCAIFFLYFSKFTIQSFRCTKNVFIYLIFLRFLTSSPLFKT